MNRIMNEYLMRMIRENNKLGSATASGQYLGAAGATAHTYFRHDIRLDGN